MERQMRNMGGIMGLEDQRQGYFLGKLVKKAKRAVKKVTKSTLCKLALLGLGAYGLGGAKFLGGKGIFALDVTDVKNPKQIFAINNNSIDQTITHWSNDGNSQIYSYAGGNIVS